MDILTSDVWLEMLRDERIPQALGDADLGDALLEIGPGPGKTTDVFRTRVDRVTAVELDGDLATALAERLAGTNVDVRQGDATQLPFPDDSFTSAASFIMLHHVPTAELQDAIFTEVARVLRPGGVFVASDSLASERLHDLHDGDVYNPVDPATLAARLTAAGFATTDVDVRTTTWNARAYVAD